MNLQDSEIELVTYRRFLLETKKVSDHSGQGDQPLAVSVCDPVGYVLSERSVYPDNVTIVASVVSNIGHPHQDQTL
jgi:hypothetical protein